MTYTPPTGAGNVTTGSGTSGTTLTTNKPSNLADGDLLLLTVYKQLGGTTFTTPSGFTLLYTATAASTRGFRVYAKAITNAAGESSTYSVTASDGTSRWIMVANRLPGMASSYLDAAPTSDTYVTNTTAISDPALTTVAESTVVLAFNFTNNSSAIYQTFAASGWANLANTTVTSGASTSVVDIEYKEYTAAGGTGAGAFTMTPSAASAGGFMISFALASVIGDTLSQLGTGTMGLSGSPIIAGSLAQTGTLTLGLSGSVGGLPHIRWGRSAVEGTVAGAPKVRWGRSAVEGSPAATPKVRWGRSAVEGGAEIALLPFTSITTEPEVLITLTAVLLGGGAADSYEWTQTSGPTVTLNEDEETCTFIAPSYAVSGVPTQAVVVIEATATVGVTTSPAQSVTVTALPQMSWIYDSVSATWKGRSPVVFL